MMMTVMMMMMMILMMMMMMTMVIKVIENGHNCGQEKNTRRVNLTVVTERMKNSHFLNIYLTARIRQKLTKYHGQMIEAIRPNKF